MCNRLYPVCTLLYRVYTGYLERVQEILTGLCPSADSLLRIDEPLKDETGDNMLIHAKNRKDAIARHPEAVIAVKVPNGYMVFDWASDYAAWKFGR